MNNNDERDCEEEQANRALMLEEEDPEGDFRVDFEVTPEEAAVFAEWCRMREEECGITVTFGPAHDPYSTRCGKPREHVTAILPTLLGGRQPDPRARRHRVPDPLGGSGTVEWGGGGYCAGDPLPVDGLRFVS